MNKQDSRYQQFEERFKKMNDNELINAYKNDIGKPGWVSSRALFITALREELNKRKLDYSNIPSSKK